MYAFLQQQQQQQQRRRQLQEEDLQHQPQHPRPHPHPHPPPPPSPYWHPQPVTPTFHNNSALAAHSPMARYQASLHAEALHCHPWSAHPPATPAPSLPPSLHRQPAPSPAIHAHPQSPWRPHLPQAIKRAPDSLLQADAPTVTRILVPVRQTVVARSKTPLNPMTKTAAAAPACQLPQPSLNTPSPYQVWIPPPQSSPTSDQDFIATNKALWLPPPGFNSTGNRQALYLDSDSSHGSDDSDDLSSSSDTRPYHAIVGPLSVSLPSKSSMSTRLLNHAGVWRTPEATRDPPPRYQASPTPNDGSPPSRIPLPIRNSKLNPLPQSTPAPPKSTVAANTPRSTRTPAARLKNSLNNNTKSPATTIRLPLIKGAQLKEKPPLPLPKNLANTPSSTGQRRPRPEITNTTLGGGATPARPVIGLDLSPKVRKNSLATAQTPRLPITKPPSAAHPPNKRAGARAAARTKSRSSSISSRRTSVSSSPRVSKKSPPVSPLHFKAIAAAIPAAAAAESKPTSSPHAAIRTSPSAVLAPAPPPMTSDELDALPEIMANEEEEVAIPGALPLIVPPTRSPASPSVTPSASPRKPPGDVKPLMVTLPSQAKNTTTVKIVKETSTDPPPQTPPQPQPQPIPSPQVAPKVAPKPVPAANVGANGDKVKVRAYNERDEIRTRTLSVEALPQQEKEREEEEEVMEIEAREIPQNQQGRRHSVDSNIDFRPHGGDAQPLQLTYPGYPGHSPRSVPMQPIKERAEQLGHRPMQTQMVQVQMPIHQRRRMSNSTGGAPSVMTKSSSGSSRFGTEYSIPEARNTRSRGETNASRGMAPPQMASLASPEVMDISLAGPFTPPQPFVPPVDDRSSRRRSRQRPPPMHADPHGRLIADGYDAPRGRQTSPSHNRNPSPARAPTVSSFEESPTVPSNAPLLAPRPQPLAVAIHEPPTLVKQSSSGGSSSSGNSIQNHRHEKGQGRKRRPIPPPQPIPVPGAPVPRTPDYSRPLPHQHQHQMHDLRGSSAATYSQPSQQLAPFPYHTPPHTLRMYNQVYSPAPPPPANVYGHGSIVPGAPSEHQGPRGFANPSHFHSRPKVLSVPTPLAPHMQGNGQTAPSSNAASVMMMNSPYQQAAAPPALYSHAVAPSAGPYQSHWRPLTSESPPPSQWPPQQQTQVRPLPLPPHQRHRLQQQGRQSGHQHSRSEPPMIEFPSPQPADPLPSTQGGYYADARIADGEVHVNSSLGRVVQPLQLQKRLSPPSQRGHTKSMSEVGPAKMNASTIARMLQAQRSNPANASSTSLNNMPTNASSTSLNNLPANASSTSLAQQTQAQAQAQSQSRPLVPEARTNTHRRDSPVRHAPSPYTQAQPSSQPRVSRRETPSPPMQAASAPILVRSNSPAGLAARKIAFDVPHGPEQDPPAAAAAPKKRRHRGRPTNPEDNMLVDPFGFTIAEDTRYDVIDKMTAGTNNVQPEPQPQFPVYRENFTAKTNALRAQEEAEAKERGRQEHSKLRRHSPSRGTPRGSPEPSVHHYRDNGPRDPHMRLYQNEPMSHSQQQLPSQQQPRPFLARLGRSSSADSTHNKLRKPRDRSQSPAGQLLLQREPPTPIMPQYRDMGRSRFDSFGSRGRF